VGSVAVGYAQRARESRTMNMADAIAAPTDHRSPTLGAPPSLTSKSVPATAIKTVSQVRKPMPCSPSTVATTGTNVAFRYRRKADREAVVHCKPIVCRVKPRVSGFATRRARPRARLGRPESKRPHKRSKERLNNYIKRGRSTFDDFQEHAAPIRSTSFADSIVLTRCYAAELQTRTETREIGMER
jgi:hypothetical protein